MKGVPVWGSGRGGGEGAQGGRGRRPAVRGLNWGYEVWSCRGEKEEEQGGEGAQGGRGRRPAVRELNEVRSCRVEGGEGAGPRTI